MPKHKPDALAFAIAKPIISKYMKQNRWSM